MICDRCRNNEASVHLTEIIRGMHSEAHLCEQCAKEIGFNTKISDLSTIIEESRQSHGYEFISCPKCGVTSDDFNENHLLGCANCYTVFHSLIQSFIGKRKYIGNIPVNGISVELYTNDMVSDPEILSIEQLKKNLSLAVIEERYEDAAILRDIIRDRENICSSKE